MKFLKLLLALSVLAQFNTAWTQDDMSEESWSEETTTPAATPYPTEDAAGEQEMPVYDESADY